MKDTPVGLKVAHSYLKKLNFVDFINRSVTWDEKQMKLSPGQLALSVVLSTFGSVRHPLARIKDFFSPMNTELLFGQGVEAGNLSDDSIARTLDKIADAGTEKIYSNFALQSFTTFDVPIDVLHGDTSSHVLYGTYEGCEAEEYDGLVIAPAGSVSSIVLT
jgi:transposase